MNILVLGGDGYLGWPTAMHLSSKGYDVTVVDNYMRRDAMREVGATPLFDVPDLVTRVNEWNKTENGNRIEVKIGDLADWSFIDELFRASDFESIVHYAEQPSAPYSMLSRYSSSRTLSNNIMVTFNVIQAIKEYCPEAHLVKLGTMGEYGTPNIDIEEGWIDIDHKGRTQKFLYPRQASSLYHTTKVMDTDLLWFYVRVWGLRATDLMQGPVYGLETAECLDQPNLMPFYSYDEIFGTVLNRFIVQAICGYPLTVYGKGGQTRGYLNIEDTLNCIRLSIENPADLGELRIFNQFTETFSVNDLAAAVQKAGSEINLNVEIKNLENPRKELEDHYYNPSHTGLIDLGLEPKLLTNSRLVRMLEVVNRYKNQINPNVIFSGVKWDK